MQGGSGKNLERPRHLKPRAQGSLISREESPPVQTRKSLVRLHQRKRHQEAEGKARPPLGHTHPLGTLKCRFLNPSPRSLNSWVWTGVQEGEFLIIQGKDCSSLCPMWGQRTPASTPEGPLLEQGSRPMGGEGEQAAQNPGWLEGPHSLSTGACDGISKIKHEASLGCSSLDMLRR